MNCKRLEVDLLQSEHHIEEIDMGYFDIIKKPVNEFELEEIDMGGFDITKEPVNEFELSYCVMYRPLWLPEWILDRWWWNDLGYWTEDGIFNDWII